MITADEMIEAYVSDVVAYLPRRQRRDVARELRALLAEQIESEGDESAERVLAGFGRPAEVAARYGTPVTLIDPADTRRFLVLALGGAGLLVLAAVFDELLVDVRPPTLPQNLAVAIFAWWGLLVAGFAWAAAHRRRRGPQSWKAHPAQSDRVNRLGHGAALAFFIAGTVALAAPPRVIDLLTGGRVHPIIGEVFVYDEDFLRLRGPLILGTMIIGLANYAVLVILGRWTPLLRSVDFGYCLTICALLTWVVAAGPVYSWPATDQAVRPALALMVLLMLADLAARLRRHSVRRAVASADSDYEQIAAVTGQPVRRLPTAE